MIERPAWILAKEDDGKKHDNPHHAGMRSHRVRKAVADESLADMLEAEVKFSAQVYSAILSARHERE